MERIARQGAPLFQAHQIGVMNFADLMCGKLLMTVRGTGAEVVFVNADELINAGWALD